MTEPSQVFSETRVLFNTYTEQISIVSRVVTFLFEIVWNDQRYTDKIYSDQFQERISLVKFYWEL